MFSIKNRKIIEDPNGIYSSYEKALKALILQEETQLNQLKAQLEKLKPKPKPSETDILIACM